MSTDKKIIKKIAVKAVNPVIHKIDATDQIVGRLATKIAILLRGKDLPTFQRHIDSKSSVTVINASKLKISGKKLLQKEYFHYSGYPGGLKRRVMKDVFNSDPSKILKMAVWNMLPKNKMRDQMIKRLKISN
ncbi:MAG: 50S ribosomal protein L13 [Patescibacteria group bacterium]|nr:50S ribosomal protein L13 [Patescibacteria group bacterium]